MWCVWCVGEDVMGGAGCGRGLNVVGVVCGRGRNGWRGVWRGTECGV